ncbi:hypothetical protein Pfo_030183 [Paulownia fortunei]|nr:hypothetical protein Pfo_030183 [Paulownia fortunei]
MVLSLLYFRMIDMRLATGVYCGSHEAFMEDVREFWRNVQIDFGNYPKLVKFAMEACHLFESLYVKEVVALHQKLVKYSKLESLNADSKKDIENILVFANEIPKAPWDEGVCRVCGIDQDNEKVLLCDECDAEYHTYCLSPPLVRVPGGNWFCPRCVGVKDIVQDAPHTATSLVCQRQKKKREFIDFILNETADLEAMMREKEYWDLSLHERSLLLKFFCNEMLDSALMREHLTKHKSSSNQHQKSTSVDLQALKDKEDSSLRSEFLGIDSSGKLYWIIDSGTNPWIIVNEINKLHQSSLTSEHLGKNFTLSGVEYLWSARGSEVYSSWACYQSDAEIKKFMDSLKDDDPIRRHLEDSILLSHKRRLKVPKESERQGQKELQPSLLKQGQDHLMTKATKVLEFKYGPFVKLETTDFGKNQNKGKVVEGKLYRCECLEPILPAGHHCLSCHKTCFTTMEFKLHGNGKCNIKSRETSVTLNGERTTKSVASEEKWKITCSEDGHVPLNSSIGSAIEVDETHRFDKPEGLEQVDKIFHAQDVATKLEIGKFLNVPVSSVWPVMGKASDVLTQLKINLLDMEAAIPKGALRASRACIDRRWAWRLFVKCASTIYEMVQALIVFEDMIKLVYLDCSWRYWSSLSAAANISTLAALSLRIYSLDAAISYEKLSRASNSLELLGKADSGKGRYNRGPKGKPRRTQKKEIEETS